MRGKKCEVSASEMMEMRREGLSNKDIAELLEISEPTVYKYIGKQGCRMERLAVFADKGKKKQPEAEEEIRETKKQMTKPKYVPTAEQYCVGGLNINMDFSGEQIEIIQGGHVVYLTYDQAAALVEFLAWAGREKCRTEVDDDAEVY